MRQLFQPSANAIARASLLGGVLLVAVGAWLLAVFLRSPYTTAARVTLDQPVPFSHQHHVGGLGIDCRYCHTSVETSSFAGMPATEICMTCHSQVWNDSPTLEPVRASLRTNTPIRWNRVYDLPDFVYFDHSIHVQKGVGCASCHGPVDQMPLTYKAQPTTMSWCLDCHRHPERAIRPRDQVFNMDWHPPADQEALGRRLVQEYHVQDVGRLTDCSTCHR